MVKKEDGKLRFGIDYRRLDKITKKDANSLPRINDALDLLCNVQFVSLMDVKTRYWQIEVDKRDRDKIVLVTPDVFKVTPFALCSAPATFQRVMETVLAGLKWQTSLIYFDDVAVFTANFGNHDLLRSYTSTKLPTPKSRPTQVA